MAGLKNAMKLQTSAAPCAWWSALQAQARFTGA